ncbi:MAG: PAS domain S-box protein [Candidatus Omnitrophica bacterium]|nr:PAS domain S-box protein [Candidatus Omnitrophota bacterium]
MAVFYFGIPSLRTNILESKKTLVREMAGLVVDLLKVYETQVEKGQISLEEAQKKALNQVRLLRFGGEHKDYFFILDSNGIMLMHPYRPDLENLDISDYMDPTGKHYVTDILDKSRISEGGYVNYYWQWVDHPNRTLPKITFVQKFVPWKWIIGAGFYVHEVDEEANKYLKELTELFVRLLFIIGILSLYLIWQFSEQELNRQKSDEKLVSREEQYRSLVETMNDGICVIDAKRRIQYVNPRFCEFLNYAPEEIIGKPIFDFLTPQGFELFMKALKISNDKRNNYYELELTKKDGTIFLGLISPQLIFDEKGNLKGGFAVISDITQRKEWERELSVSEQRFRSLFNTMREGVAVYKPVDDGKDFIFVDMNEAGCQMTKVKKEDIIGKRILDVFPYAKQMGVFNLCQQVNISGNAETMDTREYKDARLTSWFKNFVFKLTNGEIVAIFKDETETKLAELSLLESEQKYRELVENANSIILKTDINGRITFINEFALEFFGYTKDELIGQSPINRIIPAKDSHGQDLEGFVQDLVNNPAKYINHDNENIKNNGEKVWVTWTNKPIYDQDKKLTGVLSIGTDISQRKKVEEELLKQKNFTSSILDHSPIFFAVISNEGKTLLINQAMLKATGYQKEEVEGKDYLSLFVPEREHYLLRGWFSEMLSGKHISAVPNNIIAKNGKVILVEWRGAPVINNDGKIEFFFGAGFDVTEQQKIKDLSLKLNCVVEQSPAVVIITDLKGDIEYVNQKFTEITGYSAVEVLGKSPRILQSGYTAQTYYKNFWDTILSGKMWSGEICNRRKNGEVYWSYVSISPINNSKGQISHFVAIEEDITLRKEYENRLEYQANYDALTNLPNRILAIDRLTQAVARAQRENKNVAVLMVDLDRFKMINDTLGHAYGDSVLQQAAERIKSAVRESDTVARLGGDEFLVILSDLDNPAHAEIIAKKIQGLLSTSFLIKDKELFTSASIGITIAPMDGRDSHILFKNADAAMFKAKEGNRDTIFFFTQSLNEKMQERMELEVHLRHALENKEFFLHYQPLVCLHTGKIIGFEALLRWQNKVLGLVMPDKFISLCEDNGLIIPIGEWVLREACNQAKYWNDELGLSLKVAVNISVRQFRQSDLAETVKRVLDEIKLPPEKLELEITEHLLMDSGEHVMSTVKKICAMGVHFAIDDFGTGYSSLNYLQKFPFHMIKIDRSFIKEMPGNINANALIKGIISLGKSLNIKVTSEGVENREQLEMLVDYGCDYVQGFYFSKPVSPADFLAYMNKIKGEI